MQQLRSCVSSCSKLQSQDACSGTLEILLQARDEAAGYRAKACAKPLDCFLIQAAAFSLQIYPSFSCWGAVGCLRPRKHNGLHQPYLPVLFLNTCRFAGTHTLAERVMGWPALAAGIL